MKNEFALSRFTLHKNCFIAEASDLGLRSGPDGSITLVDGADQIIFDFLSMDWTGPKNDRDVAGWKYIERNGQPIALRRTVLIIND